jgi:hypothetical protein
MGKDDFKKYSSQEELDKVMYEYIRETAKDLKLEISDRINKSKKVEYV